MKKLFISLVATTFCSISTPSFAASDGVYPLTENSWDNPEFKKRFLGSYGFDMEINPKITREESEIMQEVAELMSSNPSEAIRILESSLTPEISAAFDYTIGSLYLQTGDLENAKKNYETAIKKFPNFFRAYQNLSFALVQEGEYEEAKPLLTKAIEIGGGNGTLYGLLGYSYLNTGVSSQALDSYRQALLFQPDSDDWRLGKLNSLLDMGMDSEAIGMLSDLIEMDPSKANFWMMQANAFMNDREYNKALANLELVSRMNNLSPQGLTLLGDLLLNEGLPRRALERYKVAIDSGELPVSKLLRVAEGLALRGAIKESAELADSITDSYGSSVSPEDELAILNIKASSAMSDGDMAKAATILEDIVSKDPLNGKALISLGDYYRGASDVEKAMLQYERASKVKGFEPQALIALARMEVSLKNYQSAVNHLKRANSLDPKPYLDDYISQLESVLKSS
ncbi:tetratricopeptide repeat protein [Puniceicoccaceae bacterium K14]|nr:tetratricopeptide repeat protein [Puniceicoccaceae bacterium K14]